MGGEIRMPTIDRLHGDTWWRYPGDGSEPFPLGQEDPAKTWLEEDPGWCLQCQKPYELVRPGKSQPTCDCE